MKPSCLLFIFVFISFVACNSKESRAEKEKESYEKTKAALLGKEENNPAMFIHIKGENKKNLIGQTVIKGKISSSATVAKYKDIDIKLNFYSKTQTLLESDDETIYVTIVPGATEKFKTKYFAPKGTDSVAISFVRAKVLK